MKALPRSNLWLAGWWCVWSIVLAQQLVLHPWPRQGGWLNDNPGFSRPTFFVLLLPLAVSIILRWLVLPKVTSAVLAFFVFLGGIILAAMSGLASSFLDVPFKQITFLVCMAGILEFLPLRYPPTVERA
jgi:hypothetical protein